MSNIKKREFFNVVTGEKDDGKYYGIDSSIFRKSDNVELIFSSRGEYLGIKTCRGKFMKNDKGGTYYTSKEGIFDFKSFDDLGIWAGKTCPSVSFIETPEGNFLQIGGEGSNK